MKKALLCCFFSLFFLLANFHISEGMETKRHRVGYSVAFNYQKYSGDYRDATKDISYHFDDSALEFEDVLGLFIRPVLRANKILYDLDNTKAINISLFYDVVYSFGKFVNPFIGIGLDLSIPVSVQNSYYGYKTYIGNFIDLMFRIGNFMNISELFGINIYANFGIGSAIWIGQGKLIDDSSLHKYPFELESGVKFGIGGVIGGGIDFVLSEKYFIGVFYNYHHMLTGQTGYDAVGVARELITPYGLAQSEVHVDKYSAHAIGVRIGGMVNFDFD